MLERAVGKLVGRRALQIDAHVDVCESCRAALADAARSPVERGGAFLELSTFSPGEVIGGRYMAVRRIGAGGMGEVYEVHDDYLDEVVALKTVVPAIADNSSAIARLRAEVRLARRVTHENVCRIYDLGFHSRGGEQVAFLTMELVRGVTLRERIARDGPFAASAARPLIEQMARGLGHAHAAGIVHRDFKSDNIMLVPPGDFGPERVVVMDFGLARAAFVAEPQPLTPDSHAVLGTLDYMSPEQVKGRPATALSDVYALGIVMYEMMTGRLPFDGETPLARALARVTDKPPQLRSVLPGADLVVEACISRCLMADAADRFSGMEDLLGALGASRPAIPRTSNRVWMTAAFVAFVAGSGGYWAVKWRAPVTQTVVAARRDVAEARDVAVPRDLPPAVSVPASKPETVSSPPAVVANTVLRTHRVALPKAKAAAPVARVAVDATVSPPLSTVAAPPVPSGDALLNPFAR